MKIGQIFEEINDELMALYNEGKKFFPKLKLMASINNPNSQPRFFLNYPKNKGSFSISGFKNNLADEKIKKTFLWLQTKGSIKDVNRSVTTMSLYFTFNGKNIRLSDHKRGSFDGTDIVIKWNTTGEQINNLIQSLFSEELTVNENDVRFKIQAELDSIIKKYEAMGMACWIYLKGNDAIEVASIKVKDKTQRRQGLGTALMSEITALCDKYGLLCVLTPEDTESSKTGLLRFYKRFNFVSNTGKYKDFRFRNSMIRYPQG